MQIRTRTSPTRPPRQPPRGLERQPRWRWPGSAKPPASLGPPSIPGAFRPILNPDLNGLGLFGDEDGLEKLDRLKTPPPPAFFMRLSPLSFGVSLPVTAPLYRDRSSGKVGEFCRRARAGGRAGPASSPLAPGEPGWVLGEPSTAV